MRNKALVYEDPGLNLALEDAVGGISRIDTQGRFVRVNQAYAEMLGYTPEEMSGRDWEGTIHPEDLGKVGSAYRQMLFKTKAEIDARGLKKDGSFFYQQMVLIKAFHENRGFGGHYCFIKDVSAQKIREFKEALDLKSQFIATVSHELRTPLHSVNEGINIVRDGSAGAINGLQQEFLDIAKRNVERLSRLINQVLDFQRLEAGTMPYERRSHRLNDLALEAARLMEGEALKKGISIRLELSEDLPKLILDKDKIIRVILNLLSNALKFGGRGPITIMTRLDHNTVRLDVRDEGTGIKKEDAPKLFKPFSQLASREKKRSGTGLGLAIVKKIIEQHGGKVSLESNPGQGSTLSFLLPIVERRAGERRGRTKDGN